MHLWVPEAYRHYKIPLYNILLGLALFLALTQDIVMQWNLVITIGLGHPENDRYNETRLFLFYPVKP